MTKETLLTLTDPRSAAAEAFRTLRTNLLFAGLERPLQTLLVTSAAPDGDGPASKTQTLANLGVVMAQGGRRTILVDCDLRRPRLHEVFGVPAAPGFSDWMMGTAETAPALTPTGVDALTLLPAGAPAPTPADLLSSRRLQTLITHLKQQAEIVLFDGPPLLSMSDGALLAANLDGALLVVSAGHTRRDHALRAKELLDKIHVRVVGAVLTNAAGDALSAY
ncbi:MAG: CpsD/CapB family tyrosine-protein kinase [Anaerolineales bacterium]|nr:CpsD/CapB family tyrosine-protein kinase [Anaerolineales bacterium]